MLRENTAVFRPGDEPGDVVVELAETTAPWPTPDPLPDTLPAVPNLDAVLLPGALRPWLEDIAERVQCPIEYPAVGAMVALSAVVGRQLGVRPRQRDDWTVVPNLWGAIVGRPGQLKSPALAEAMRPLRALEAVAKERHERDMVEYRAKHTVNEAAANEAKKAVAKAVKEGNRQRAHELALAAADGDTAPPARCRYVTSDSTVEALGELLAANPRGILVHRDELVGWLSGLDREGREGSRAFFLESWNGDGGFTYDRIGRGTIDIDAVCVSILGGIQPGPLGAYLRGTLRGGAGDDGLLQRFQLVVWPDAPQAFRDVDRWPDSAARDSAREVFERLDEIDAKAVGAEQDGEGLPYLRLDNAAYALFREWRAELEQRLREGDEHPAFEATLAKYRSLVPSLALLIHLVDAPDGGPVTEYAMLRAIAWAAFLEQHARRLYAPALDPALHAARELDRHIRAGDLPNPFRARDAWKKGWRLLDRQGTDEALEYLADLGHVRPERMDTGGRPTTVWHINPTLREG